MKGKNRKLISIIAFIVITIMVSFASCSMSKEKKINSVDEFQDALTNYGSEKNTTTQDATYDSLQERIHELESEVEKIQGTAPAEYEPEQYEDYENGKE